MSLKSFRTGVVTALLTGIPFAILLVLQSRSMSRLRDETVNVLRQASEAAADSAARQIQREFGWPAFNLLERVNHQDVRRLRFAGIADTIATRQDHLRFVDRVFVWSREQANAPAGCRQAGGAEVYFFAIHASDSASPEERGVACNQALGDVVLRTGIRLANLQSSFTLADKVVNGQPYQFVYHFLYDQTEQRIGLAAFVGFTIDPVYVRDHYFPQAIGETLAVSRQRAGLRDMTLSIIDDGGHEVYRSGRSLAVSYDAAASFPFLFFDTELLESLSPLKPEVRRWSVRSGYASGSIAALVEREMLGQQMMRFLLGLAALAGVMLTARAAAAEVRIAELKSEFMSSVSHELKSPLAKIQLFAETLASGRVKTPDKAQDYYAIIRGQAQTLAYLIGVMLEFAKIESGVRRYQLEEINLTPLLESSLAAFRDELELKGFRVETSFPPNEVPVRGNTEALQQLFGNLISNSIKYSGEERHVSLAIRTNGHYAIVDVTDRGIGIPAKEQRRIFQKFYRVGHGSSHDHTTGSGLGLAIVVHVARAHRGSVSVRSAPGAGSTFSVRIPLIDQEVAAS